MYGTKKLPASSLASFQGPALLVYNDATFTRTDFESIQRIGDSLKKSEEKQSKIGRFGIGFNSVYHMTDLPSFVSTQYVVILDPQARFLPDVNPSNPGKMIDYLANPEVIDKFSDQFSPYEAYKLNWKKAYDGTLFRLPLRTPEQASSSLLSKRALSPEEVEDLLFSLQLEASAMLLFLKNIETIEIKIWSSHEESEASLIYSCSIDNMTPALRQKRSFVGESLKLVHDLASGNARAASAKNTTSFTADMTADYSLRICCTDMRQSISSLATAPNLVSDPQYFEEWEICNQLGGGDSTRIAQDPVNSLLRLVPWGGVAALVASTRQEPLPGQRQVAQSGLAYCFLPLPVPTGLPGVSSAIFFAVCICVLLLCLVDFLCCTKSIIDSLYCHLFLCLCQ